MSLLHRWLNDASRLAPAIGRRAVAAAAARRSAEEERWEVQLRSVLACAQPPGGSPPLFTLRCCDAEETTTSRAGEIVDELDTRRWATCRFVFRQLGKEPQFFAAYGELRGKQLAEQLAEAGGGGGAAETEAERFLERHQLFFSTAAGFFHIEAAVMRASGGLISPAALAGAWDRCSSTLAARLSAALACASPAAASAPQLLALADYVRLLGAALREEGLWTASLDAALHEAQERWAASAQAEALQELRAVLAAPNAVKPLQLDSVESYEAEVVSCGLHPREAPLPTPADFPLLAPFTPRVPRLLRLLEAHSADCVLFCGARGEEGLLQVLHLRDALLTASLDADHLGGALAEARSRAAQRQGQGGVETLVQLAADAAALDCAAEELDARIARRCKVALVRAAQAELSQMEQSGERGFDAWAAEPALTRPPPPRRQEPPGRHCDCYVATGMPARRRCSRGCCTRWRRSSLDHRWRTGPLPRPAWCLTRLSPPPPLSSATRSARLRSCSRLPPWRASRVQPWAAPRTCCWRLSCEAARLMAAPDGSTRTRCRVCARMWVCSRRRAHPWACPALRMPSRSLVSCAPYSCPPARRWSGWLAARASRRPPFGLRCRGSFMRSRPPAWPSCLTGTGSCPGRACCSAAAGVGACWGGAGARL